MKCFNLKLIIGVLTILAFAVTPLLAADKDELQRRFKERYPQLLSLQKAGTVGETDEGYAAIVKGGDAKARKLLEEENADRRALYDIIAKEQNTTPAKVAIINAKRNHEKLEPGMFFRQKGEWVKKE
jgi:uncharacterized protein